MGLNDANKENIFPELRSELKDFLKKLPNSFLGINSFTDVFTKFELLQRKDWNLKFKFDELANWGNQSIVAHLIPLDGNSNQYQNFLDARSIVCESFKQSFAIEISTNFYPHITLGYFANAALAQTLSPQMAAWTNFFKEQIAEQTITFNSVRLYGFTDMITFFA